MKNYIVIRNFLISTPSDCDCDSVPVTTVTETLLGPSLLFGRDNLQFLLLFTSSTTFVHVAYL
jgi:hypothetical protein